MLLVLYSALSLDAENIGEIKSEHIGKEAVANKLKEDLYLKLTEIDLPHYHHHHPPSHTHTRTLTHPRFYRRLPRLLPVHVGHQGRI